MGWNLIKKLVERDVNGEEVDTLIAVVNKDNGNYKNQRQGGWSDVDDLPVDGGTVSSAANAARCGKVEYAYHPDGQKTLTVGGKVSPAVERLVRGAGYETAKAELKRHPGILWGATTYLDEE